MATNKLCFTKQQQLDYIYKHIKNQYLNDEDCEDNDEHSLHIDNFILHKRGWDCLSKCFWCDVEVICDDYDRNIKLTFDSFGNYFGFVKGKIYENSCYFQYTFSDENISLYKIRIQDLNFISFDVPKLQSHIQYLKSQYKSKHLCGNNETECSYRINCCSQIKNAKTDTELFAILKQIASDLSKQQFERDINFYIRQVYFAPACTENLLKLLVHNFYNMSREILIMYCLQHGLDLIKSIERKGLRRVEERYIMDLKTCSISYHTGFDSLTNFFYVKTCFKNNDDIKFSFSRDVATFEEFVQLTHGNLTNADLSYCRQLPDLTGLITTNIKLPISNKLSVKVKKVAKHNSFVVELILLNNDVVVANETKEFEHVCDWLKYLNYDISDADVLECPNFKNLNVENIQIDNLIAWSEVKRLFGLPVDTYSMDVFSIDEYQSTKSLVLKDDVHIFDECDGKCYYISDLHLLHQIKNIGCQSWNDIQCFLRGLTKNLVSYVYGSYLKQDIVIFNGDTCSDPKILNEFCKELHDTLCSKHGNHNIKVFFTLGNHEYWDGYTIDQYKSMFANYGFSLLQDNMFIVKKNNIIEIPYDNVFNQEELLCLTNNATTILIGGTGFAGYNNVFNANNGIYRNAINRHDEILLSKNMEKVYDFTARVLQHANVIVATHMPMEDWHSEPYYIPGFVYLHGHTHKNRCIDNDVVRLFADNQIGYHKTQIRLRCLTQSNKYDIFHMYEDGVYQITSDQYKEFYHGKQILMDFYRQINELYMLKKNGIYCFIHKSASGKLQLLNGGAMNALKYKDIMYYFNNMDRVIDKIQKPMNDYTKLQKQVASIVRSFGGQGYIHGCIVDIDFYNHLYVNPNDGTVVPYFAYDIIDKHVYNSLPNLLKAQAPQLYKSYQKLLESPKENALIPYEPDIPIDVTPYYSTDIYSASRIIKKMQKLEDNILSIWIDVDDEEIMNSNNLLTESFELKDD